MAQTGSFAREDILHYANGNRTAVERRVNANDKTAAQTDIYTRTAGTNKLASIDGTFGNRSITYDARGNTQSESRSGGVAVTTGYDGYGRLVSLTRTGEEDQANIYNGMDERVVVSSGVAGGGTTSRRFVYDPDGRVLGEYGSNALDVIAERIWMIPEVADSGMFGGDDGTGGYAPIAIVAGTTLAYVHANHMGVPQLYTVSSGAPIATPNYTLPGFPGQFRTFADLYYNKYRDYDTTTGRYIQADPIGLAGGQSPYSYAMGNPLRYTDPSGEFVPLAILGGALLGVGIELGTQAFDNWRTGRYNRWQDIFDQDCYEWGEVAVAGGMGAFGGSWVKGLVRLPPGSMIFNNVSRRIRRADDLIGKPIDLHHWAIPQRWGLPDWLVNRPWNLNPVPRKFHQKVLNPMGWPRAVINGAPWQIQAGVGLGLGGSGRRNVGWLGMTIQNQPLRPFLAMNRYYICRFDLSWLENLIGALKGNNKYDRYADNRDLIFEDSLKKGLAALDATIIDANCLKFSVTGIATNGLERDIFNLFGLIGRRRYYFKFLVGEPEQLSFEQARDEIVEHICRHRWIGQTGGTPAHFRKLQASKKNMAELIEGISFYGKWPF